MAVGAAYGVAQKAACSAVVAGGAVCILVRCVAR